jgi:hypothetical protein
MNRLVDTDVKIAYYYDNLSKCESLKYELFARLELKLACRLPSLFTPGRST